MSGEKSEIKSPSGNVRLALYLPSLRGGGAERVMLTLAGSMVARGYLVDLVLANAHGPYVKEVPADVRIVDLRAGRVLASLPGLVAYLRRERPSALLATMGHANVIALMARWLSGVPMRLVVREANVVGHGPRFKSLVVKSLIRQFYPRAESVIAVSRGVADDLITVVPGLGEKIQVIYNPVIDEEIFRRAESPVAHPWFNAKSLPVILAAGRLVPQKNYSGLLRAFNEVKPEICSRLVILGEGPERPALEGQVRQLGLGGSVDLPGFVDNPYAFMARADLFVLSSDWEGLPSVLIQSLALGTPVVATDCPTGPREILEGGRLGELVPVGDSKALARAICRSLASPVRVRCPENWRHRFTVEAITEAYLKTLLG